jgi:hypothetical protein
MNMKKVAVLMCVVSMSTGTLAFSFMGPPTAELEQGQWKAGYTFSYLELDVEGTETSFNGEIYTFKPAEITRHYFSLGYGVAENFELNLLLGHASIDLGDFEYDDGGVSPGDFHGSDFSFGFNAKYAFVNDKTVDWGAMLEMAWFSGDGTWEGNEEKFDAYDLKISVGPTINISDWAALYGGGYFYMLDGDLQAFNPDGTRIWLDDLREEDSFGGYVGAVFKIREHIELAVEGTFSSDTLGVSAKIGWRF